MMVEVDGLVRRFGSTLAVDRISFGFDRGTIFGFVGPNGAGKTTTMRILSTIEAPTEGDARVCGHSVVDEPDAIRRLLGFVPDYYGTYPATTVGDYLDFFGRTAGLRGEPLTKRREGVVEFTGVGGIRDKMMDALSKGMKQRLALGRVLMADPQVLILDEPTAGLDPRARIEFRELVKVLAAQGKAVLISSHILTELEEMVHGCVVLEKGRVVCQGTVEEVRREARRKVGARAVLRIDLLEPRADAERFLREQPFVSAVRGAEGRTLMVEFEGGAPAASVLLKGLVDKGFPVVQFQTVEASLEEVFMSVTKGEVQ